jgi:adenylate cyclase class 2
MWLRPPSRQSRKQRHRKIVTIRITPFTVIFGVGRFLTANRFRKAMEELEAKILEINRQTLEQTLIKLGAEKIFDGNIETIFFDYPDHTIIKAKDVLRLRKENNQTELTYKKVQITPTAKKAHEETVQISDFEAMQNILKNLGLSTIEQMQKHRTSYKLDQARFDIDHYTGTYAYIPEFLEIEAENVEQLYEYAKKLGFTAKDCLPWSTQELIKHYAAAKKEK